MRITKDTTLVHGMVIKYNNELHSGSWYKEEFKLIKYDMVKKRWVIQCINKDKRDKIGYEVLETRDDMILCECTVIDKPSPRKDYHPSWF